MQKYVIKNVKLEFFLNDKHNSTEVTSQSFRKNSHTDRPESTNWIFFIILFLIKVTVYVEYPTRVKHEYMLI